MANNQITVVVPTYNRKSVLLLCLQSLEEQTINSFDVVVVDDGSTDGTLEELYVYARTTPLYFRFYTQRNSGPARARNLAILHTRTPVAILIGDDILATPTFVETHLHFHQEHAGEDQLALGWTRWDTAHQRLTPFMQWYEKIQFDYASLLRGRVPTWEYAYTSNLSFKTSLFRENPFDEGFRYAAFEDSELAYRLNSQGRFKLSFLREAMATHVHPTTFLQAAKRMETVGAMTHLFYQRHPEARPAPDAITRFCSTLGRHPHLLTAATTLIDRIPVPGKLHSIILRAHREKKYQQAQAEINK